MSEAIVTANCLADADENMQYR